MRTTNKSLFNQSSNDLIIMNSKNVEHEKPKIGEFTTKSFSSRLSNGFKSMRSMSAAPKLAGKSNSVAESGSTLVESSRSISQMSNIDSTQSLSKPLYFESFSKSSVKQAGKTGSKYFDKGSSGTIFGKFPLKKLSEKKSVKQFNGLCDSIEVLSISKTTEHRRNLSAQDFRKNQSMLLNREQSLKDYQILRKIGAGGFGKVYLVKLKHATGTYFAMKMITKADIQKHTLIEQITNEVTIQTNLNHCFIVQLELYFQTASYFCILLEYVACGDLYHLLLERKHFSEDETKFYICELIVAFEYLHEQKIIFRDLKPENVLLDSTGHIKLADFGFSKKIFRLTNSFCGTPDYIAPEMIVSKPYTFAVDWWGVGVLTYELTFGQTPFYSPTIGGVYRNILEAKVSWVRNDVSQQLKSFIMDLLVADQKRRLGYKGAVELKIHEWFSDIKWNIVKSRGLKPPIVPPLQYIDELEQNDNPLDNTDSDEIELGEQVNAMPDIVLATTPKKNHSI